MYTGAYTCFMSSHSITRQESLKALTVLVTDKAEECVERQSLKHSFMKTLIHVFFISFGLAFITMNILRFQFYIV